MPGAAAVLAAALLAAAAKASVAGTFDSILANLAVTFEGNTWTQEVQYTCNEATVAYTLIPSVVALPHCETI